MCSFASLLLTTLTIGETFMYSNSKLKNDRSASCSFFGIIERKEIGVYVPCYSNKERVVLCGRTGTGWLQHCDYLKTGVRGQTSCVATLYYRTLSGGIAMSCTEQTV